MLAFRGTYKDMTVFNRARWKKSAPLLCAAAAIAALYALPLALGLARSGARIDVFYPDEAYYAARVLDASRGGSLGNPYLAGHENAPKYLPELTERALAAAARALRIDPLTLLAASRVAVPVLLFLALAGLAGDLGIQNSLAAWSAASVAILPPVLTLFQPADAGQHGFLRLFRIVSPVCHMLLLTLVLRAIVAAWKGARLSAGLVAGAAIAFLLSTPIYYGAFAAGGAAILAIAERGPRRRALIAALLAAGALSIPFAIRHAMLWRSADVAETLARFGLMITGRGLETDVARRLIENSMALVLLGSFRTRIGEPARFLAACLLGGELLLVQNVVTNRQVQAFHWMHCLFLLWPLAAAAALQSFRFPRERIWYAVFAAILVPSAAITQVIAFAHWEERRADSPQLYTLNLVMPRTLCWLNSHTPPGSVVIASEDVMASLPLSTRNRVYWAYYAGQHVLSEREVRLRLEDVAAWNEEGDRSVRRFRADYGLLTGPACFRHGGLDLVYRNGAEETCVVKLAGVRNLSPGPSP